MQELDAVRRPGPAKWHPCQWPVQNGGTQAQGLFARGAQNEKWLTRPLCVHDILSARAPCLAPGPAVDTQLSGSWHALQQAVCNCECPSMCNGTTEMHASGLDESFAIWLRRIPELHMLNVMAIPSRSKQEVVYMYAHVSG